jgi:cation transport protein ChaC
MRRQMTLTADLVARVARVVEDLGPSDVIFMTDGDYKVAIRSMLEQAPAGDLWLFGYGSLLWKPACEVAESRVGKVRGWHRAFCIRLPRFRGTPDRPGLMMGLDRGGQCRGMVFRLPPDQVRTSLGVLFRREMIVKPSSNLPPWLAVETDEGPIRALGFVTNRRSPRYAGKLAPDDVAEIVATAAGHWGSCAEYLRETVARLEELGIRDRNLWRLQALVAERITAAVAPPDSSA